MTATKSLSACLVDGKTARVFQNPRPIDPARTFWRVADDGVDHGGVERAVNHQRFGNGEHRRAMNEKPSSR